VVVFKKKKMLIPADPSSPGDVALLAGDGFD
jgi:hypothetical protein